jgi:hypothetical protein
LNRPIPLMIDSWKAIAIFLFKTATVSKLGK